MVSERLARAAAYWSSRAHKVERALTRWWQRPDVVERVGRLAGVDGCRSVAAIDAAILRRDFGSRSFGRAVSVGCGEGTKELGLLGAGVVRHFTLAEISSARVDKGRRLARERGLEERAEYHVGDAFDMFSEPRFDLVYWNNSLHHMLDVEAALRWSRSVLEPGGVLYLNDYVAGNRMQQSERVLEAGTQFRRALPGRLLRHPRIPLLRLPRRVTNESPAVVEREDPTECADSARILSCLGEIFPNAHVIPIGGGIYHSALNDVLANLDETRDASWLDLAFELERRLIDSGHTQYAIAVAQA